MKLRTVFFLSDGTGVTAETFGNAVLAQFDLPTRHVRLPFIDTLEKATEAIGQINNTFATEHLRPLVFSTLVNVDAVELLQTQCQGMLFDMFATFVNPLELELGMKSHRRVGRFNDASTNQAYIDRIAAIDFSLAHDDGQMHKGLEHSDVILIGVSRSGKTPTSLYLAMQYGLKVSNYPLIPEDFERQHLPEALMQHKTKIFGLSIAPERLRDIRFERRPNSTYASLENCRLEINAAESMMRRSGIQWLSTTTKSIEEIAATILQRHSFD